MSDDVRSLRNSRPAAVYQYMQQGASEKSLLDKISRTGKTGMEEQKEISETGTKGTGAKQENEGVLKTAADFVSTFVVTIVVIIAILLVIGRFTGIHLFNVESGSMTPEYPVGTLLIDKETDPSLIEQGDVVTFIMNEEGMLVTHRVVSIDRTDKTFTTKGDANNVEDPEPVMWGNVIGKVMFSIPFAGKPFSYITAEENRKVVIGVIAGLLILSLIWDFTSKKKGADRK